MAKKPEMSAMQARVEANRLWAIADSISAYNCTEKDVARKLAAQASRKAHKLEQLEGDKS